jgi:hypothetical protein
MSSDVLAVFIISTAVAFLVGLSLWQCITLRWPRQKGSIDSWSWWRLRRYQRNCKHGMFDPQFLYRGRTFVRCVLCHKTWSE